MNTLETLYKKTSNGLTQYWKQEISPDNQSYRSVTGKLDGVPVISEWTKPTIKNVGKNNETTIEQQVLLEVESNYKKKLAQGNYKNTLDNVDSDNYFKPMLAKKYREDHLPTSTDYRGGVVWSQPKLDGVRCVIKKEGMFSRQGKEIISAPHIYESVKHIFDEYPDLVLDGELYTHRLRDDFDAIISMVRKTKPNAGDLEMSKKFIEFWVYDLGQPLSNFCARIEWCERLLREIGSPYLKLVDSEECHDEDRLDVLYGEYMENGFEGQMVRISGNGYENKRAKQLLKRKEFVDEEFVIHDIKEGIGNRSGMAGRIEYVLADGRVVGSGIRGDFAFFTKLYEQRADYIGTQVTIRYQNLTPDGVPRFAVATKFWKQVDRTL